jgi:hypothetical protein
MRSNTMWVNINITETKHLSKLHEILHHVGKCKDY